MALRPKPSFAPPFTLLRRLTQRNDVFCVTDPQISHALDVISGSNGGEFLLKHRHPNTKIDPTEHGTIARLRKEGWTLQRMADRFGASHQCIHQILKRYSDESTR